MARGAPALASPAGFAGRLAECRLRTVYSAWSDTAGMTKPKSSTHCIPCDLLFGYTPGAKALK